MSKLILHYYAHLIAHEMFYPEIRIPFRSPWERDNIINELMRLVPNPCDYVFHINWDDIIVRPY